MAQPVTVYRWDDPGAPQIGSGDLWPGILNILKKCLVEGYGTKAAAGWTVEYEDVPGNKCVFRNDPTEGSGGYVQFQRQNNTNIWYKAATFMLDIDQFTNSGFMSSTTLSTTFNNGKWFLIASKTGFYLNFFPSNETTYSSGYGGNTIFCGDFVSFIKNDPGTFISVGYQAQSETTADTSTSYGPNNYSPIHHGNLNSGIAPATNSDSRLRIKIPLGGDGSVTALAHVVSSFFSGSGPVRTESIPQGPQLTDKLYLVSGDAGLSFNPNQPNIRGFLPGLITLPAAWWFNATWPVIADSYLLLSDHRANPGLQGGGRRMINLVAWEAPNRD